MGTTAIIFWLVLLALAILLISIFNTLVKLKNRFLNAFAQIEVQLKPILNEVKSIKGKS